MPEPLPSRFVAFAARLEAGGVSARRARRMAEELAAHFDDLCAEAESLGLRGDDRSGFAAGQLGREEDIAAAVLSQPALRAWIYRHPALARILLPVAWVIALPGAPLAAGVQHAPEIARWGTCLFLSAAFTAALLLVLELTLSPF